MKGFQSLFLSIRRRLSNRSSRVFPKPVKRIVQATLIAVRAVTSLLGLGLLAINLYVQSPGTQVRLREIVSENLGYPVSVFRISFTPWNGFHLQDVTIQDPSVDYPLLKAQDLWIRCNYLPLFRRKLIVREVVLNGAEIRIPTSAHLESETESHELPAAQSAPPPNSKLGSSSVVKPGAAAPRREKAAT